MSKLPLALALVCGVVTTLLAWSFVRISDYESELKELRSELNSIKSSMKTIAPLPDNSLAESLQRRIDTLNDDNNRLRMQIANSQVPSQIVVAQVNEAKDETKVDTKEHLEKKKSLRRELIKNLNSMSDSDFEKATSTLDLLSPPPKEVKPDKLKKFQEKIETLKQLYNSAQGEEKEKYLKMMIDELNEFLGLKGEQKSQFANTVETLTQDVQPYVAELKLLAGRYIEELNSAKDDQSRQKVKDDFEIVKKALDLKYGSDPIATAKERFNDILSATDPQHAAFLQNVESLLPLNYPLEYLQLKK